LTQRRRDGGRDETPFGAWVRGRDDLHSQRDWMNVNDADWLFHRYKTHDDANGTRKLQHLMFVEVKTHCSGTIRDHLPDHQREVLFYHHQLLTCHGKGSQLGARTLRRPFARPAVRVWHYGVFVLAFEGGGPQDGTIAWCRFEENGGMTATQIWDAESLAEILRFERDPRDIRRKLDTRRHHKTQRTVVKEEQPLGFTVEREIVDRS